MDRPVIVGVDGSESSLWAVDWAADEAALREVPLHVVYASLWERYEQAVFPAAPGPSEQILTDVLVVAAAKRARQRVPGTDVTTEVVPEGPVSVLLGAARKASVLVIGSRGRGSAAELLLGSVGLAVAGQADGAVIIVRGDHANRAAEPGAACRRGSPRQAGGLGGGAVRLREAARRGVPLVAVRAWCLPADEATDHAPFTGEPVEVHRQRAFEALETGLREPAGELPRVEVRRRVVEGPARAALLDASADAALLSWLSGYRRLSPRYERHPW
ncbi:universal stress protein [Streptomyces violaceochromogenes]|uniref:Universal stress protein n=1 Tax=Streptomyces violaceochromogenes TaxID=67377 RepID=A0ABU6LRJ6_9ACTN|nr:universal stress protein [Streptomyces violaceochromogenes]MEC7051901.1 universal stress protein [Streptomyces violaceochromogenes]GHC91873.1 universal stress protein [Streptomyces violaceochromogenes]